MASPLIAAVTAFASGSQGDISSGFFAVETGNPTHYFWSVFAGTWGTLLAGLTALAIPFFIKEGSGKTADRA